MFNLLIFIVVTCVLWFIDLNSIAKKCKITKTTPIQKITVLWSNIHRFFFFFWSRPSNFDKNGVVETLRSERVVWWYFYCTLVIKWRYFAIKNRNGPRMVTTFRLSFNVYSGYSRTAVHLADFQEVMKYFKIRSKNTWIDVFLHIEFDLDIIFCRGSVKMIIWKWCFFTMVILQEMPMYERFT